MTRWSYRHYRWDTPARMPRIALPPRLALWVFGLALACGPLAYVARLAAQ
jgi:hypothetical protein